MHLCLGVRDPASLYCVASQVVCASYLSSYPIYLDLAVLARASVLLGHPTVVRVQATGTLNSLLVERVKYILWMSIFYVGV